MKDEFLLKNFSLRNRIFFSLIFLSIISSVLISAVSVHQFREEAHNYHQYRLERKEIAINENINYILTTTPFPLVTKNLQAIFKDKIHELAAIHDTEINLHDLRGNLVISSKGTFSVDRIAPDLSPIILKAIQQSPDKRFIDVQSFEKSRLRVAYSYLKDDQFKPLGILAIPYEEKTEFYENEIKNFMIKFGQVYIIMLIMSIAISYFLSNYIIQNLKDISNKIKKTTLGQKNEKIENSSTSKEISTLINAYNDMVDKLDESYHKLAQSEREQAWREMAKQVAHEVKNPLTPMRLTVQSFERRFDPEDPDIRKKLKEFSLVLIQQIDTMSSVATAFSSFASMPAQKNETLDVVKTVKLSLDIFNEPYINFTTDEEEIISKIDQTQLIRIITNLVKNAIQAMPETQTNPSIDVTIYRLENQVVIQIKDNGTGIGNDNINKVFQPKFTTKSSGMGLGLGIIKNIVENYEGTITFKTKLEEGTTFTVTLPIIEE
ncbi:ATP-binding protein [Myroides pelagicus]|uniref:histidine kinase n=1 Tax=Myroides pelagicus TaxID=270914 RepID=A0A7K1GPS4_9FLAO|nr:ATP-binding protein [Myroides pelagicus]MEC4112694.1 ATP-binding protein [Myroides pelagicus]MTH30905.1 GHKL domain-containing protein [Myroides pelagicus]